MEFYDVKILTKVSYVWPRLRRPVWFHLRNNKKQKTVKKSEKLKKEIWGKKFARCDTAAMLVEL